MIREIGDHDIGRVFTLDSGKAVAANLGKKCLLRRVGDEDCPEIEVLDCSDSSKYLLALTGLGSEMGGHIYTYYAYVPFVNALGNQEGYKKELGVGHRVTNMDPGYSLLDEELKKAEL